MKREEIIEMARQAGMVVVNDKFSLFHFLELFAKLVADKEQEAIIDLVAFYGGPVDLEAAIRARSSSRGEA